MANWIEIILLTITVVGKSPNIIFLRRSIPLFNFESLTLSFNPHAFKKGVSKQKLAQIFIFTLLCGISKGFMKALKAFIKHFDALQRSVKIKI